jgi:quercetin dioxygenase-like cupin family protein
MFKINKEDQPVVEMFQGVIRHTLAGGKDVLMARFEYTVGAAVPTHKHSYEQVTTILSGKQKILIEHEGEREEIIVATGDSYIVPAGFTHEQVTLEAAVTIDAWSIAP